MAKKVKKAAKKKPAKKKPAARRAVKKTRKAVREEEGGPEAEEGRAEEEGGPEEEGRPEEEGGAAAKGRPKTAGRAARPGAGVCRRGARSRLRAARTGDARANRPVVPGRSGQAALLARPASRPACRSPGPMAARVGTAILLTPS